MIRAPRQLPDYSTLTETLAGAMQRFGIRSEPGCYLFGTLEDIPEGMPTICGIDDWTSDVCATCAEAVFNEAVLAEWDRRSAIKDYVVIQSSGNDGEGPRWCPRCGVYLTVGFTSSSIEGVLDIWSGKRLRPDCLPEILEALKYYGECPPFWCGACSWNSPMRRGWKAPTVVIDVDRWAETAHIPVDVPCCGCRNLVHMPAREARLVLERVADWRRLQRLALRAYRQLCC